MFRRFLPALVCLSLSLAGWSDTLFVRNRPYQGYLQGTAQNWRQSEVDIHDVCKALGLWVHESQENWWVSRDSQTPPRALKPHARELWVNEKTLDYRMDAGRMLVRLGDFADLVGATLTRNAELQSIDMNLVATPANQQTDAQPDMSSHRLLYFGADWAPASKVFKPVVEEFESRAILPVTYIDCTQPRSANYKNNINFFQGNQIPYTVLVSPRGKVLKTWTGYQPIGPFITEIQKLTEKP